MRVIERNFFRLLRNGAFGGTEAVEPLSAWKWRRLYQLSLMHGVSALIHDGITRRRGDFFAQLPPQLAVEWQRSTEATEAHNREADEATASLIDALTRAQTRPILLKGQAFASLYPTPQHRTPGDIDLFFPLATRADKADQWAEAHAADAQENDKGLTQYTWYGQSVEHHHTPLRLTNPLANRRLQALIAADVRASDSAYATVGGTRVETLSPSLTLLICLVRVTRYLINDGISLKQLVDLGLFLRKTGDKVDYVKVQQWLRQLGMHRMARVTAAILTDFLGFDDDEMQFVTPGPRPTKGDMERIRTDIFHLSDSHTDDWYFTQGKNIFVRTSDSGAMMWHIRHNMRYFRYCPAETVTNFVASFAHSISHIEE